MTIRPWVAGCVGLVFGLGLSVGGMTQPAVVLGFLDVFGAWNPVLAGVMGGAVLTTTLGFAWLRRRRAPWLAAAFLWPANRHLDAHLIVGAALFGVGWGLAGYCPGPALASLGGGQPAVWLLVVCMGLGWWWAPRLWPHDRGTGAKS